MAKIMANKTIKNDETMRNTPLNLSTIGNATLFSLFFLICI